eukprot:GHVS01091306.1.p1 GENE.GHVS01091306.1~~GHVS01091306.1.p1  ORF type:complete len:341 (-),score=49.42 GHVS01091306.1:304-1326(-)
MFASSTGTKQKEAQTHLTRARKALKTNVWSLKFSPDYDIAALEFSQAAQCFHAAGDYQQAVSAHENVAKVREGQGDCFGSGRAYEAAGTLLSQQGEQGAGKVAANDIIVYWKKAASCYKDAGKVETCCRLLLKLARLYSDNIGNGVTNVAETQSMYDECIELYELDDKPHYVSDVYKDYINFLCATKQYDNVLSALDRHIVVLGQLKQHSSLYKAVLSKVVLFLFQCDMVAADLALSNNVVAVEAGFMGSREFEIGVSAVEAFQARDSALVERCMSAQVWKYLPVEIARIANQLKLPEIQQPSSSISGTERYQQDQAGRVSESDEEEGGGMPKTLSEMMC